MPSPVAHSLAGLALAWSLRDLPPRWPRVGNGRLRHAEFLILAAWVFASIAPDLDFIPGLLLGDAERFHRGPSHSLGAAVIFGLLVALAGLAGRTAREGSRLRSPARVGLLMGLAYSAHLLLDLLTADYGAPFGLPLLWPISSEKVVLPFQIFVYIRRSPDADNFVSSLLISHNLLAVLWELVVMSTVLLLIRSALRPVRTKTASRSPGGSPVDGTS